MQKTFTESSTLTIATRESALALWQAEFIKSELQKHYPQLTVNLLGMTTKGDQILDSPLSKIGGKGLFVKELEASLLDGRADLAVHSMKDVPMHFPQGLELGVICKRHNPFDAFVSNQYQCLADLPKGAVVGTSSLRRQSQLLQLRPDLVVNSLRGNVNTRLRKLDEGEYDAIILAASGLQRLGMDERIAEIISSEQSLPAVGQGALGIEVRSNDQSLKNLLSVLIDPQTTLTVAAERAMNTRLNGGCQVPIAGFAQLDQQQLSLSGLVAEPDGSQTLMANAQTQLESTDLLSHVAAAEALGVRVAEDLLAQGAEQILAAIYRDGQ